MDGRASIKELVLVESQLEVGEILLFLCAVLRSDRNMGIWHVEKEKRRNEKIDGAGILCAACDDDTDSRGRSQRDCHPD